ncbi:cell division protein FtsZ [Erysipelothrix larvae]|uniref:Cell division protein FtsZ n=1 Tax=Erysipelothrix larvae TaxID=1514105 RepID=A0A0X8GZC3_9FIRM|nr:DUF4956 domain-containing protein [Erysipelothrix larvae]AMC93029.1 cell division protein FtsZ [Erysipelothrix larvae]
MVNQLFTSIFEITGSINLVSFLICIGAALLLGYISASIHTVGNTYSKGFVVSLALLPAAVCVVIMMVNGNVGTGVAVAGAFSLVRFRSLPGTAREISSIFLTMAIGLATGMGYIGYAVLFVIVIAPVQIIYSKSTFGEKDMDSLQRTVRITVPESLNYTDAFDEAFDEFTTSHQLLAVKTSNMGSMYRLTYSVLLKQSQDEKNLVDALRVRNGNLEISSSQREFVAHEL